VWFKNGPALRFAINNYSSEEKQFYLRRIHGVFELVVLAIRSRWWMMINSMIGCRRRSETQLDALKEKK
jgi:hypothetical protein